MADSLKRRLGRAWQIVRGKGGAFNDIAWGQDVDVGRSPFSRANLRLWLSGTNVDYAQLAGPMWANSAVASGLLWIMRNSVQAPPQVQTMAGKPGREQAETIPNHPLTELLLQPNDYYDWTTLLCASVLSWFTDGNAYWLADLDRLQRPVALWYCPHWMVEPARDENATEYLTHYWLYPGKGQRIRLQREQVVQLRFGLDPAQPLRGLAPLAAAIREVYTDVEATNYGSAILQNMGVVGAWVSAKEYAEGDPAEIKRQLDGQIQGDRRGGTVVSNLPIDVSFPAASPESMALDKIRQYPESRIAGLLGLPAQLCGLIVGEATKTYANYSEAREAGWEECVLPNTAMMLAQAAAQLLPRMRIDPTGLTLCLDTTNVRPLQPDRDKLHTRVRDDYKAGLIDRAEARAETDRDVSGEDEGHWATDDKPEPTALPGQPGAPGGNGTGKPAKGADLHELARQARRALYAEGR